MREIKFRGMNVYTKIWHYGYLVVDEKYTQIWQKGDVPVPVDRETVGQFTGKLDKNETEIYEGDIITGVNFKGYGIKNPVIWWGSGWYAGYDDPHNGMRISVDSLYSISNIEVTGNIHEEANHGN